MLRVPPSATLCATLGRGADPPENLMNPQEAKEEDLKLEHTVRCVHESTTCG